MMQTQRPFALMFSHLKLLNQTVTCPGLLLICLFHIAHTGRRVKNVSSDLHMEHLNQQCKKLYGCHRMEPFKLENAQSAFQRGTDPNYHTEVLFLSA